MLAKIRSSSKNAVKDQDLAEARKWAQEALAAEEAQDWARAIVCYRRALDRAPFCQQFRDAFEEVLDAQIAEQLGRRVPKQVRHNAVRPVDVEAEVFDDEDTSEDFEEDAAPRPVAVPSRPAPRVVPAAGPRRRAQPAIRPMRWVAAACVALLITGSGVLAATAATGWVKSLLQSDSLPAIAQTSIPDALATRLKTATDQLQAQKPKDAAETLRTAAKEFPEHESSVVKPALAIAVRMSGRAELEKGNFAKAAEIFGEATTLDPQNTDNWIDLGRSLREHARSGSFTGNPEKQREILAQSEKAFNTALSLSPQDRTALLGVAQVFDARNNREKAIEYYERLVVLAPESLEGRLASTNLSQLKKR